MKKLVKNKRVTINKLAFLLIAIILIIVLALTLRQTGEQKTGVLYDLENTLEAKLDSELSIYPGEIGEHIELDKVYAGSFTGAGADEFVAIFYYNTFFGYTGTNPGLVSIFDDTTGEVIFEKSFFADYIEVYHWLGNNYYVDNYMLINCIFSGKTTKSDVFLYDLTNGEIKELDVPHASAENSTLFYEFDEQKKILTVTDNTVRNLYMNGILPEDYEGELTTEVGQYKWNSKTFEFEEYIEEQEILE